MRRGQLRLAVGPGIGGSCGGKGRHEPVPDCSLTGLRFPGGLGGPGLPRALTTMIVQVCQTIRGSSGAAAKGRAGC